MLKTTIGFDFIQTVQIMWSVTEGVHRLFTDYRIPLAFLLSNGKLLANVSYIVVSFLTIKYLSIKQVAKLLFAKKNGRNASDWCQKQVNFTRLWRLLHILLLSLQYAFFGLLGYYQGVQHAKTNTAVKQTLNTTRVGNRIHIRRYHKIHFNIGSLL